MDGELPSLYDAHRLNNREILNIRSQTLLGRGAYVMEAVNRTWDPEYNSVLEIGTGAKGYVLVCPYEPYCIAAAMGGLPYSMTIIEKNYYIVKDLLERRSIYHIPLMEDTGEKDDEVWESYLTLIGEAGRTVEYAEQDLIFPYWINDGDIDRFRARGIFSAPIPPSFEEGLNNGGVSIINQTLERFVWSAIPDMSVTLGVIINVLPYLKEYQQRTALANIREKLTPDGKVLISGYKTIYPFMDFVFRGRSGGWIDESSLAEIGLQVLPEDKLIENDYHGMWFLSRL